MTAFLCFLLGVLMTLLALAGWLVYLAVTAPAPDVAELPQLTQLAAERRLHQLRQDAVAQLLHAARNAGREEAGRDARF